MSYEDDIFKSMDSLLGFYEIAVVDGDLDLLEMIYDGSRRDVGNIFKWPSNKQRASTLIGSASKKHFEAQDFRRRGEIARAMSLEEQANKLEEQALEVLKNPRAFGYEPNSQYPAFDNPEIYFPSREDPGYVVGQVFKHYYGKTPVLYKVLDVHDRGNAVVYECVQVYE